MAKPSAQIRALPLKAKELSISVLVISLPLLYVSLLHVPPSSLFTDTTFWFLMSNSLIFIVAADSGIFSSPAGAAVASGEVLHDEYVMHLKDSGSTVALVVMKEERKEIEQELIGRSVVVHQTSLPPDPLEQNPDDAVGENLEEMEEPDAKSVVLLQDSVETEGSESDQYSSMSDEELNKRVEEFITKINREIRLQQIRN
ncbi:uncharacterized protein LOC122029794 [Zingiber officinale]|uniref:uncharacterized protein LOC122029794 n=1 Tax=Zingiber officinale TaxID=94328 RepID=UPI001C4BE5BD|nr:uncharacterized protein LOC122029794 [Zingiber officinale]